jgi:hypothetical protein
MILAGIIPWLSSTQGFSRAIAQLLAYSLIPLVVNISDPPALGAEDSHWYLRSVYRFLDENPEMKRLRKKQQQVRRTTEEVDIFLFNTNKFFTHDIIFTW